MIRIHTQQELYQWLQSQSVQTNLWGRASAKTVQDLWREIEFGETTLTAAPATRHVRVVSLLIKQDGKRLIELSQQLHDGRIRRRNHLPSEKFKAGEDWQTAAMRCLLEELHIEPHQVMLDLGSHTEGYETKESLSFPTLLSRYEFHRVEAAVDGLPNRDFCVANKANAETDAIVKHWWGWR